MNVKITIKKQLFGIAALVAILCSQSCGMEQNHCERLESGLVALTDEIKVHILSFLEVRDLTTMSEVDREFYGITQDESLWRNLCLRERLSKKSENISWKTNFIDNHTTISVKLTVLTGREISFGVFSCIEVILGGENYYTVYESAMKYPDSFLFDDGKIYQKACIPSKKHLVVNFNDASKIAEIILKKGSLPNKLSYSLRLQSDIPKNSYRYGISYYVLLNKEVDVNYAEHTDFNVNMLKEIQLDLRDNAERGRVNLVFKTLK